DEGGVSLGADRFHADLSRNATPVAGAPLRTRLDAWATAARRNFPSSAPRVLRYAMAKASLAPSLPALFMRVRRTSRHVHVTTGYRAKLRLSTPLTPTKPVDQLVLARQRRGLASRADTHRGPAISATGMGAITGQRPLACLLSGVSQVVRVTDAR
ncbi:MAG: hypothetical protein ACRELY_03310, partial [Polyangiaceae bacterium]